MSTPPIKVAIVAVDRVAAPIRLLSRRITDLRKPVDDLRQHVEKLRKAFSHVANSMGVTELAGRLGKVRGALGELGSKIGGLLRTAGLLGGIIVGGMTAIVLSAARAGGELYNTSRRLGMSVEALQELQYAAKQADIPVETFNSAVQKMGKNAVDAASGVKNMKSLFDALGVRVKDSSGKMRGTEAILIDVFDSMRKLPDPLMRNRVAFEMFGRGAVNMVQMLEGGPEALANLREEARRLGVMSEADARAAEEFGDALGTLQRSAQGLINVIGGAMFPALIPLVKQLTELVISKREEIAEFARAFAADLPGRIMGLVGALQSIGRAFQPFVSILTAVVKFLGPTGSAITVIAGILAVTLGPAVMSLIASIVMLNATVVGTPIGWIILGIVAAVAAAIAVFANWKKIVGILQGPFGTLLKILNPMLILPIMIAANWEKMRDAVLGAIRGVASAGKFVAGLVPTWIKDRYGASGNSGNVAPGSVLNAAAAVNSTRTIRNEARLRIDVSAQNGATASVQQYGGLGPGLGMGPAMVYP